MQELHNLAVNEFLTITEPPFLRAVGVASDGSFQFETSGGVGFRYRLEISTDAIIWNPWMNLTNTSLTMLVRDSSPGKEGQRFYRAVMPDPELRPAAR